ncbi:MAG: VWA domain-containing protein [Deltaproteobacteria bacterium]|nr:VWA domain-containing protein [Deltaproteobacteria bacterium]
MKNRYTQNTPPWLKFALTMAAICIALSSGRMANADAQYTVALTDIMIVLDLSGSMGAEENDDRFDAFFSWITAFSTPKDRVGIVAMGNGSKLLAPLTEWENFRFADYRKKLRQRAKYTDVAAGLENAYYELKNNTRENSSRLIILFSDAQIDMPKGMWDMENSLRYLHDSLVPSMKQEHIQLLAVVPDGLKANFQLLQELTSATNGAYFRGVPGDAVAIRQQFFTRAKTVSKGNPSTGVKSPTATSPEPLDPLPKPSVKIAKTAPLPHSTQGTSATPVVSGHNPPSFVTEFMVLGAILLLGFAIVLTAIVILFKRTAGSKDAQADELVDMLHELQSLKTDAQKSALDTDVFNDNIDGDDEPDFGEPQDRLSVSLISPFLDYQEARGAIRKRPVDEIAIKPAFSEEHTGDINLSVSNMETLIGTGVPEVEDKK